MSHTNHWITDEPRSWYIAHTKPQCELKAMINARENGWTVFLPWFKERPVQAGRAPRWRPLLPGYLFAAGGPFMSLYALRNPMYVNRLLDDGRGLPYRIPDTDPVMAELLSRADAKGYVEQATQPLFTYDVGSEVMVTEGLFRGQMSKVLRMEKGSVKLEIVLMGAPRRVSVPHGQVERVA